jgi:hypothetical protein
MLSINTRRKGIRCKKCIIVETVLQDREEALNYYET